MNKEKVQQEIRKAILVSLYNKKLINKTTYLQAQKAIVKDKGKEVA